MTHFKDATELEFPDRNFQILRRRWFQMSKIFTALNLKLNFQSNDMHLMHIALLESEISQMF